MSASLRYEIKFPLDAVTPAALAQVIATCPAGFCELYPERLVNNVYFDTPRLDAYRASVEGLSERAKLRLRWYGEAVAGSAVVELKLRRGAGGWKRKQQVGLAAEHLSEPGALLATLRPQLDPLGGTARRLLGCVSLRNRYRRAYYISRDGRCRLTVDRELELSPHGGGAALGGRGLQLRNPVLVVELKAAIADREALVRASQGLPYRPRRFSKYTAGLGQLLGRRS